MLRVPSITPPDAMKSLIVGDPHVVVEELADCERLVDAVLDTIRAHRPEAVLWLGDLFNNHALVRIEVLAFWRRTFERVVATGCRNVALVGNHDLPQSGADAGQHALMAFGQELVDVVSEPEELGQGMWCLPYMDRDSFVQWLQEHPDAKGLVCHQTFQGARYENGFYAPDGVPTEALPKGAWVISGHIHSPQRFGAVWYPGAPRWRSIADAGCERHLHVVDLHPVAYDIEASVDLSRWCRRIDVLSVSSKEELLSALGREDVRGLRVNLAGDREFVEAAEKALKDKGVRFRAQVTRSHDPARVRESEGVDKAFQRYWENVQVPAIVARDALRALVSKRLGW